MKTAPQKYFSGLLPKRGFTAQFKELDFQLRELKADLTHFVVSDGRGTSSKLVEETKELIRLKMIELTAIAKDPEAEAIKAEKQYAKEHRAKRDPNQSDLGIISDAILGRS